MDHSIQASLTRILEQSSRFGVRALLLMNHLRDTGYDREDPLQYLAFVASMASQAKGQLFQDLWALWVSGQKRGGYFVEFGAANGVYLSNTWLLEKSMSWKGVLAEPNPTFHDSLKANRSCAISTKCVYTSSGQQLELIGTKAGEYSYLSNVPAELRSSTARAKYEFQVETISLNDLLIEHQAPRTIDYLSADTEGSEFEILSAFDFDRWDVRSITVEHNNNSNREKLYGLLVDRGFRRLWTELSLFDDWYVKD